jgi:hypothetical protein
VILLTGAQGDIARAHHQLFEAVIDKPYKPQALLALVKTITGNSKP